MSKPIIVQEDPWLEPYSEIIRLRYEAALARKSQLTSVAGSLKEFAGGFLYYGLHRTDDNWLFREWAPNADQVYLIGEFNDWQPGENFALQPIGEGNWEIILPAHRLTHGQRYRLLVKWQGGEGPRIPTYTKRCIQNESTKEYDAQVWAPEPYHWHSSPLKKSWAHPLIYEAHVGMATEDQRVGSYTEFRERILPRIKKAGYNTIQLMAIQEHPYYGSFGYHVSNYFAVSSRCGSPEELKMLIDAAHAEGIAVIMDIVHSHAVKNQIEGLGLFDGDPAQYFHGNHRREHIAWDSLCFDYGKDHVMHFLLSNCRFWLEEYHFDGFRFDGVTSMLYYDHGLEKAFTSYDYYFDGGQDGDAITYLSLANELIHEVNPNAFTVAEEMSGMPGLAEPFSKGGIGFDYRLAMGIPDYWIKIIKERGDEAWDVSEIYRELNSRRAQEKTVAYCESHDQALVGDKTIIFRLIDKEMYWFMNKSSQNLIVDRGIALHKMIRLVTFATSGGAYLTFMGNEFGHPEWIDFPREGNGWSYNYARRQWSLMDNNELRYHYLSDFDREMLSLENHRKILDQEWCNLLHENGHDQILAFERGQGLFVFNFNPARSYTDYGIQVSSGRYRIVLDTDDIRFGGFGNIDHNLTYFPQRMGGVSGSNWLKLYLPSRTAIVLERIPPKSIYEV
jgi:1,4-alpha-glucan branching enzyme